MGGITKSYVLGFLFNDKLTQVVLIRKDPKREEQKWQKGLLNGIGGGVEKEDGNEPTSKEHNAMRREFKEETGVTWNNWIKFARMFGPGWECNCFAWRYTEGLEQVRTTTHEEIGVFDVMGKVNSPKDCVDNLDWLLLLARDTLRDMRPRMAEIQY